jgi:putative phosphoesterase
LRIAVLSDTHIPARLSALPGFVYEACADSDLIIHAGDVEEPEVIDELRRLAPVKAVKGNMDLLNLPQTLTLNPQGFKVCVAHGSGPYHNVRERLKMKFLQEKPDIIIHGHTHIYHWSTDHNTIFLCPGAIANPAGNRSMVILTLEAGKQPEVKKITS